MAIASRSGLFGSAVGGEFTQSHAKGTGSLRYLVLNQLQGSSILGGQQTRRVPTAGHREGTRWEQYCLVN